MEKEYNISINITPKAFEGLARQERLAGSLYGKIADVTYGGENAVSIDEVREALRATVTELAESAQ